MRRFQRLIANAGISGGIQLAILFLIIGGALWKDARLGILGLSLPLCAVGLTVPYLVRTPLVRGMPWTMIVMNIALVVGILMLAAYGPTAPQEATWFRLFTAGCVSTYLGCYFWLVSDERVRRRR